MSNLVALSGKLAARFGMGNAQETLDVLKATAFKSDKPVSDAQMTALLIVADQYGLNPWTKEIYAYPDKNNGIVPVVGVDGWSRIINEHPEMDGLEFNYSPDMTEFKGKQVHVWVESVITRKDRSKPIIVREYFDEVSRDLSYANPWQTHPKRMHRHKATIQGARLAFGFVGIYDQDEADRILEKDMGAAEVVDRQPGYNVQERTLEHAPAHQQSAPARSDANGSSQSPDTATPNQVKLIKARLAAASKGEAELCSMFSVAAVEALPKARVNEALDWISGKSGQ